MRLGALAPALLALVLTTPATAASSRATSKKITLIERQSGQIREVLEIVKADAAANCCDVRGRSKYDDLRQWCLTEELQQRLTSLINHAREVHSDAAATTSIDEAQGLINDAMTCAEQVSGYWRRRSAVRWREHWRRFAGANGIPVEPLDPQLLTIERTQLAHLDKGEFAAATQVAGELDARLATVVSRAAGEIARRKDAADLRYMPPAERCVKGEAPTGTSPARVAGPASPAVFYPPSSKRRDEEGDIVVRVRVSAKGCATGIAVAASSGYPDLDAAAIRLAEHTRYAPAADEGRPVDGEVTFLVRFALR